MEFEAYLQSKKIDPEVYGKAEPDQFKLFRSLFMQMHPKSFTSQKLFLINDLRRRFPFTGQTEVKTEKKRPAKPVMKRPAAKPAVKAKPKTGKPVVKPKVAQTGKARPIVKKPVIKKSEEEAQEEVKKVSKKPVIKPKIVQSGKPKPVVKKPIIKPKINKDQK